MGTAESPRIRSVHLTGGWGREQGCWETCICFFPACWHLHSRRRSSGAYNCATLVCIKAAAPNCSHFILLRHRAPVVKKQKQKCSFTCQSSNFFFYFLLNLNPWEHMLLLCMMKWGVHVKNVWSVTYHSGVTCMAAGWLAVATRKIITGLWSNGVF